MRAAGRAHRAAVARRPPRQADVGHRHRREERGVHAALQRALAAGRGEKDYLAVVYGRVNVARGEIELAPRARSQATGGGSSRRRRSARRASPIRAARARGRAARRTVAVALPARHGPHASDPRPPGGARLAARRRSDVRRAALAADRRSALAGAADISPSGAPRLAPDVDPSGHAERLRLKRPCRAISKICWERRGCQPSGITLALT